MELSDRVKQNLFYSDRQYSDRYDAFVEMGPKRIIEYFEHTISGTSFPELMELPLTRLVGSKTEYRLREIPEPVEVDFEIDRMAFDCMTKIERQRDMFEHLIIDSNLMGVEKDIATDYLDYLTEEATKRFEKYLIEQKELI